MQTVKKEISFSTNQKIQLLDITKEADNFVRNSSVNNGLCLIYTPHSTAAIAIAENEKGLVGDMVEIFSNLLPKMEFAHNKIDNNAESHILSTLLGQSKILPIEKGILTRGFWQNIFFVELDGPRGVRKVILQALG